MRLFITVAPEHLTRWVNGISDGGSGWWMRCLGDRTRWLGKRGGEKQEKKDLHVFLCRDSNCRHFIDCPRSNPLHQSVRRKITLIKSGIDTTFRFPLAQSEVSSHNQNDFPPNNQNDSPQNNQNVSHTTLNITYQYHFKKIRFRAHTPTGIIPVKLTHWLVTVSRVGVGSGIHSDSLVVSRQVLPTVCPSLCDMFGVPCFRALFPLCGYER